LIQEKTLKLVNYAVQLDLNWDLTLANVDIN
jgi:hypothetical protein